MTKIYCGAYRLEPKKVDSTNNRHVQTCMVGETPSFYAVYRMNWFGELFVHHWLADCADVELAAGLIEFLRERYDGKILSFNTKTTSKRFKVK